MLATSHLLSAADQYSQTFLALLSDGSMVSSSTVTSQTKTIWKLVSCRCTTSSAKRLLPRRTPLENTLSLEKLDLTIRPGTMTTASLIPRTNRTVPLLCDPKSCNRAGASRGGVGSVLQDRPGFGSGREDKGWFGKKEAGFDRGRPTLGLAGS
jgi:hypothetical protein